MAIFNGYVSLPRVSPFLLLNRRSNHHFWVGEMSSFWLQPFHQIISPEIFTKSNHFHYFTKRSNHLFSWIHHIFPWYHHFVEKLLRKWKDQGQCLPGAVWLAGAYGRSHRCTIKILKLRGLMYANPGSMKAELGAKLYGGGKIIYIGFGFWRSVLAMRNENP